MNFTFRSSIWDAVKRAPPMGRGRNISPSLWSSINVSCLLSMNLVITKMHVYPATAVSDAVWGSCVMKEWISFTHMHVLTAAPWDSVWAHVSDGPHSCWMKPVASTKNMACNSTKPSLGVHAGSNLGCDGHSLLVSCLRLLLQTDVGQRQKGCLCVCLHVLKLHNLKDLETGYWETWAWSICLTFPKIDRQPRLQHSVNRLVILHYTICFIQSA